MTKNHFSGAVLHLDLQQEVEVICKRMKSFLIAPLKRRGLIVAVSGGIDSSVSLALAVRAVGSDKVFCLQMPEAHSSEDTLGLSSRLVRHFGVEALHEDITSILQAVGFYHRYDEAVRQVIPEYDRDWKSKIAISNVTTHEGFNYFTLIAQSPDNEIIRKRLPHKTYLSIVAATNFKQRIRKMLEYYHADRLHYAVIGTPNRLEYDQGFFVKLGDGAADIKPIAHLYKSQVYQMASYLGVPEEICSREPTTDTYSLEQGQDEFYFSLPYAQIDLCLWGKNHNVPPADVALALGLQEQQVKRIYQDIDIKRAATRYLQLSPLLISPVPEINNEADPQQISSIF